MRTFTLEQLDELNTLQTCIGSVADLLAGGQDISVDKLSVLLGYLNDRLAKALNGGEV